MGRTGAVTPVANLKPVLLAGTTVKRASLHNANEIARLDLHEGDAVFVEKGGEIIPKITAVNTLKRKPDAKPVIYPANCPECGSNLIRQEGEAVHYCPNDEGCPPQIVGKIQHFISRKAMNIEGIGQETIETFYRRGYISHVSDLYTLFEKEDELKKLERFGEKSISNMLEGIEKSKEMPFEKVLYGLGIRYVGETVAKKITAHFKNIDSLMNASYDELISVDEIGERIAESIITYFNDPRHIEQIEKLRQSGLQFESGAKEFVPQSDKLNGLTFVISGVFEKFSRDELSSLIEMNGGKILSGISAKLNYLIAGDNMGPSKLEKATRLNIPIIGEDEFLKMIG